MLIFYLVKMFSMSMKSVSYLMAIFWVPKNFFHSKKVCPQADIFEALHFVANFYFMVTLNILETKNFLLHIYSGNIEYFSQR